jgi:hypothetical protein
MKMAMDVEISGESTPGPTMPPMLIDITMGLQPSR